MARGQDFRSYRPEPQSRRCEPYEHRAVASLYHYCVLCRDTGYIPLRNWSTPTETRCEPEITY